jgi:hypothetical protein
MSLNIGMRPYLYFVLTENCNLRCRHYYLDACPGKEDTTIPEKDFRAVIRHLPKVGLDLNLGGGELFSIKDVLYSSLDYIRFENRRRERNNQGQIEITVQTNGSLGRSDERILTTLEELSDFEVHALDIASGDRYHFEQGVKLENLQRIVALSEEYGLIEDIEIRGTAKRSHVVPIGRAAENGFRARDMKIPQSWVWCKDVFDNHEFVIRQDGSVYPCCFGLFSFPGNVIQEPLVNIVRRAKRQKKFKMLNAKGPRPLFRAEGYSAREVDELIRKRGLCGMCFALYPWNE